MTDRTRLRQPIPPCQHLGGELAATLGASRLGLAAQVITAAQTDRNPQFEQTLAALCDAGCRKQAEAIGLVAAYDVYYCVTVIGRLVRLAPLSATAFAGWCGRKICDNQE